MEAAYINLRMPSCMGVGQHTSHAMLERGLATERGEETPLLHADIPGASPISKIMLDFHCCFWGSVPGLSTADDSLAAHFDSLNDPGFGAVMAAVEAEEAATGTRPPIISASHFLPLQELLPEKRMLVSTSRMPMGGPVLAVHPLVGGA